MIGNTNKKKNESKYGPNLKCYVCEGPHKACPNLNKNQLNAISQEGEAHQTITAKRKEKEGE